MMHFAKNNSDTFYCTQIAKTGIEGNPNVVYLQPINEYLDQRSQEAQESHVESKTDTFNEHTFIGFVPKNGFSIGATKLQTAFKSAIVCAMKNSIANSYGSKFTPLPKTANLINDEAMMQAADHNYRKLARHTKLCGTISMMLTNIRNINYARGIYSYLTR